MLVYQMVCDRCGLSEAAELSTPEQIALARRYEALLGPEASDERVTILLTILESLCSEAKRRLLDFYLVRHHGHAPRPCLALIEPLPPEAQRPWSKGGDA